MTNMRIVSDYEKKRQQAIEKPGELVVAEHMGGMIAPVADLAFSGPGLALGAVGIGVAAKKFMGSSARIAKLMSSKRSF